MSATELVTPELQDHLSAVHEAVYSAEESLRSFDADDAALQAEDALTEDTLAFLEMHADLEGEAEVSAETETEADAEMEAAFGIDEEDNEAFLETGADADAETEADADSDAEAEAETGVAGTVVMKMESGQTIAAEAESLAESENNAEAGSVTVPDMPANHEQDADPIVTEQMETQAAIDSYQMLEADSEAEAEAEAEMELEADTEAEAEAEMEAEPLPEAQTTEDGVAYTKWYAEHTLVRAA